MGRPRSKTESIMQDELKRLDKYEMEPQIKRAERRVLKKSRTKHLRTEGKNDLRRIEEEYKK